MNVERGTWKANPAVRESIHYSPITVHAVSKIATLALSNPGGRHHEALHEVQEPDARRRRQVHQMWLRGHEKDRAGFRDAGRAATHRADQVVHGVWGEAGADLRRVAACAPELAGADARQGIAHVSAGERD